MKDLNRLLSVAFNKLCFFLPQFENPVEKMYTHGKDRQLIM